MFVPDLRPLFTLNTELGAPWEIGDTPIGRRRVFDMVGGQLTGRLSGRLLPSGCDFILMDLSGTARLDMRQVVELEDGAYVYMQAQGRLALSPELRAEAKSRAALVAADPARYYYRFAQTYETGAAAHRWLNDIQAVGTGRFTDKGVVCDVFELG